LERDRPPLPDARAHRPVPGPHLEPRRGRGRVAGAGGGPGLAGGAGPARLAGRLVPLGGRARRSAPPRGPRRGGPPAWRAGPGPCPLGAAPGPAAAPSRLLTGATEGSPLWRSAGSCAGIRRDERASPPGPDPHSLADRRRVPGLLACAAAGRTHHGRRPV